VNPTPVALQIDASCSNCQDPRSILATSPMSALQVAVVAITVALTALDGFDVIAVSIASPGIAAEWHVDRAVLGIVLSAELGGMAAGSLLLGLAADRMGRRPIMLGCLVLMSVGMLMAAAAKGSIDLSIWRALTGFGIGGILATVSAIAAEFSNVACREMSVSVMSIGYPLGATLSGLVGSLLLRHHDWRSIFYVGGAITTTAIPVLFSFMPESLHWLTAKQPAGALVKINRTLNRFGHPAIARLPLRRAARDDARWTQLFSPHCRTFTTLATLGYSFHILTYYYVLKWLPTIVVDMGFKAASAAGVLFWTNMGSVVGAISFGLLAKRIGLKRLTAFLMTMCVAAVAAVGNSPPDLKELSFICACVGFCGSAGIVGLYAIFVQGFPIGNRASGTGFGLGVGRGASVVAPIAAGLLLRNGISIATVSAIMGIGSLIGAVSVAALSLPPDRSLEP
jgi:benzoate transport